MCDADDECTNRGEQRAENGRHFRSGRDEDALFVAADGTTAEGYS